MIIEKCLSAKVSKKVEPAKQKAAECKKNGKIVEHTATKQAVYSKFSAQDSGILKSFCKFAVFKLKLN